MAFPYFFQLMLLIISQLMLKARQAAMQAFLLLFTESAFLHYMNLHFHSWLVVLFNKHMGLYRLCQLLQFQVDGWDLILVPTQSNPSMGHWILPRIWNGPMAVFEFENFAMVIEPYDVAEE